MKTKKERRLNIRLSDEESKKIHEQFSLSTSQYLCEYARKKLLEQPINIKYRNSSLDDFVEEVILLQHELDAVVHSFDQAIEIMALLRQDPEIISMMEKTRENRAAFLQLMAGIKEKITIAFDLCLQGL